MLAVLLAASLAPLALFCAESEGPACEFEREPAFPAYFWDPSCASGVWGCRADGRNTECRFCGVGEYANVSCPPSSCRFRNEPFVPYYWDPSCEMGMAGCWADGVHPQCRYCGKAPYTGVMCPDAVDGVVAAACTFDDEPSTPHYWDPSCTSGMPGCLADRVHENCRFCGGGDYSHVSCPTDAASRVCTFANEPTVPYYWDESCTVGMLGCLADGVHPECRFCARRPFEGIPCPASMRLPADRCHFPANSEPGIPYYWDRECRMGVLGCWADGLRAECRFCGRGVYGNIICPGSVTPPSGASPSGGFTAPADAVEAQASAAAEGSALSSAPAEVKRGAVATKAALGKALDEQPAGPNTEHLEVASALTLGLGARSIACWLGVVCLVAALPP